MIRVSGWGGGAVLHPQRIRARYTPGMFETTQLVVAGAAVVIGAAILATSVGVAAWRPLLAPVLQLGALVPLAVALGRTLAVIRTVWEAGPCRILVRRGWIEIGPREVRRLEDARLQIEHARLGLFSAFARLTLAFPDGQQVPLVQGPRDEVLRFERQLRLLMTAPEPSSFR